LAHDDVRFPSRQRKGAIVTGASRPIRRAGMIALRFALVLLGTLALAPAYGQMGHDEAAVKAAFIVRFAQYVDWPRDTFQNSTSPLAIATLGASAVNLALAEAAAIRSSGRPVVVVHWKAGEAVPDSHIVYVGSDQKAALPVVLGAIGARAVLVVSDFPQALEQRSMINFVVVDGRVRFEISPESAEKAGLTISSRLLAIAMRVYRGQVPTPVQNVFTRSAPLHLALTKER
jgi:hypothetical protein